jgi:uncharacterized membrane protein
MVEVIKHIEEKLGSKHRASMRGWWRGWHWAFKLWLPLRFLLAWRYNWQERRMQMILAWLLPILVVAIVLLTLTAYGIQQLKDRSDSKVTPVAGRCQLALLCLLNTKAGSH